MKKSTKIFCLHPFELEKDKRIRRLDSVYPDSGFGMFYKVRNRICLGGGAYALSGIINEIAGNSKKRMKRLLSVLRDLKSVASHRQGVAHHVDSLLHVVDAIVTEGTLCVSRILQETVMKLSNVTSLNLYNRIREQALSEGIIKKTANEFDHVCYYRPKAEKKQEKQDAITDLFSAPLGDIPF